MVPRVSDSFSDINFVKFHMVKVIRFLQNQLKNEALKFVFKETKKLVRESQIRKNYFIAINSDS